MPRSPISILVIDDHSFSLHILSHLLSDRGYQVRQATRGKVALQMMDLDLPDLILLDVQLSDMDGYAVCAQLKADPRTREIPVIFLTERDNTVDKVTAFEVGSADYITKPFQVAEVLARIQHQLTIQQQRRQLLAQNQRLQQEIQIRRQLLRELKQANLELQHLATVDMLTQLANRRRFDDYLAETWQRLRRDQQPLSLLLVDVDHFKAFNDHYGHPRGDLCLRRVAQAMQPVVQRPADLVARYGGEEFAVILPNTDAAGAVYVARRLQRAIIHLQIPHVQSPTGPIITISLGVATRLVTAEATSQELIAAADSALYLAKEKGRNGWQVDTVTGVQTGAQIGVQPVSSPAVPSPAGATATVAPWEMPASHSVSHSEPLPPVMSDGRSPDFPFARPRLSGQGTPGQSSIADPSPPPLPTHRQHPLHGFESG